MAHKKRLFIAINLPADIKKRLAQEVEKIQAVVDPSIRFMGAENWHITLTFLGDQDADAVNSINGALAEIAARFEAPHIAFEKIVYGPVGRTPRMIWLVADRDTSKRVGAINDELQKALFESGIQFEQEHRQFNVHITLARFNALNRETLPELQVPFRPSFEARSLDLMESHLNDKGSEYVSLGSFDFEGDER